MDVYTYTVIRKEAYTANIVFDLLQYHYYYEIMNGLSDYAASKTYSNDLIGIKMYT